jgi:Type IV secretion system pilin
MKLETKRNIYLLAKFVFLFGMLYFQFAHGAHAQQPVDNGFVRCGNGSGDSTSSYDCTIPKFFETVARIVNYLIQGSGVVAVCMVVVGGFKMVMSNGNEKGVESGKKTVTYGVIGLCIVLVAILLVQVLLRFLGFEGGDGIIADPASYL